MFSFRALASDSISIYPFVLDGWSPAGLADHMLIHAHLFHLIGNLVFLWVFGNAICANTNNVIYPILYIAFGVLAAVVHNVLDGSPVIGASGAINGIVGMATALYPTNRQPRLRPVLHAQLTLQTAKLQS